MGRIDFSEPKYPDTYNFVKEGQVLEGTVMSFETVTLTDRDAPLMTVQPEEGPVVTLWLGAVLKSQIEKEGVKVGSFVGIMYKGEVKGKNGMQPYKNYDLRVVPVDADDLGPV